MTSFASESESWSDSDADDDASYIPIQLGRIASDGELFRPFDRCQSSFLSNLVKLLNEGEGTGIVGCMRWSPRIVNALEVNWQVFKDNFEQAHRVLVVYKLARANNKAECVRATINRKLREWKFDMINTGAAWTSYIYCDNLFGRWSVHGQMPFARR